MDLTEKEKLDEINKVADKYVQEGAADAIARLVSELKEHEKRPYATGLGGYILDPFKDLKTH